MKPQAWWEIWVGRIIRHRMLVFCIISVGKMQQLLGIASHRVRSQSPGLGEGRANRGTHGVGRDRLGARFIPRGCYRPRQAG